MSPEAAVIELPSERDPLRSGGLDGGSSDSHASVITTPAGSTIEPVQGGGYRVCDAGRHCLRAPTLWQAQQLVQWAEVHHQPLEPERSVLPSF